MSHSCTFQEKCKQLDMEVAALRLELEAERGRAADQAAQLQRALDDARDAAAALCAAQANAQQKEEAADRYGPGRL